MPRPKPRPGFQSQHATHIKRRLDQGQIDQINAIAKTLELDADNAERLVTGAKEALIQLQMVQSLDQSPESKRRPTTEELRVTRARLVSALENAEAALDRDIGGLKPLLEVAASSPSDATAGFYWGPWFKPSAVSQSDSANTFGGQLAVLRAGLSDLRIIAQQLDDDCLNVSDIPTPKQVAANVLGAYFKSATGRPPTFSLSVPKSCKSERLSPFAELLKLVWGAGGIRQLSEHQLRHATQKAASTLNGDEGRTQVSMGNRGT